MCTCPFCRHRCGYCNFSVVAGRDDLIDRFLGAIDAELSGLGGPEIDTLFVGGGTPTHLTHDQLARLLGILVARFQLADEFEWSVEANPEDIDLQKLQLLVDHGVNRLSLGVQSLSDRKLKTLERGHQGDEAVQKIAMVAERIPNVSIDLIFAAPGESPQDWRNDLEVALAQPVTHLSTYALTFEKGTAFWNRRQHGQLHPIREDAEVQMYKLAQSLSADAGFEHYEISNFARPGFQCRHNLSYWRGQGWLAAGPGAARFVDGCREVNHRSTTTYLKRIEAGISPVAEVDQLSTEDLARERAAFGVRMTAGIDLDEISIETGADLQQLCGEAIASAVKDGFVKQIGSHVKLTKRGVLFADAVARELLG